jgi:hypothetical protein
VTAATLLALLTAGLTSARRARAAGEDEWQLSARLGGANRNGNPLSPWGYAGALDVEYGIDDAWAGRASVGTFSLAGVEGKPGGGTTHGTSAVLGLTYVFDVLRLVPYAVGGLGVVRFDYSTGGSKLALAAELGVGGDYLLTPRWSCGASAQYLFAPLELINNAMDFGGKPLTFSLTLRVSRTF